MTKLFALLSFLLYATTDVPLAKGQGAFRRCHLLFPKNVCFSVYSPFKNSLVYNEQNIYELQEVFYPIGKFAKDRLVNIVYNVVYEDPPSTYNDIPDCLPTGEQQGQMSDVMPNVTNLSFLTGWTSSGVYNLLSPLRLTVLQLQLFNDIYNLFLIPGSGIFLPDRFGWVVNNNQGDRVNFEDTNTANITIRINNTISCLPNMQLTRSILVDLTVMLKVWASSSGRVPEMILEENLGYVTEPGFYHHDIPVLEYFQPFFAATVCSISFLLGLCALVISATNFHNIYGYLSLDRQQFKFYYFSGSFCAFVLNIVIFVIDLKKTPQWCSLQYFDYITDDIKEGCDGTIISKILYFVFSIITSFIAALISSKSYEVLELENQTFLKIERFLYIITSWFLILFVMLVGWAIPPTILQILVYHNLLLAMTLVMIVSFFWFTVLCSIPPLLLQNLKRKMQCLLIYHYLAPIFGMILVVFIFGFVTITYLNAVVFGTDIGGIIGLLAAIVPSILLSLFTEFYRDWFLTKTTGKVEEENDSVTEMATIENVMPEVKDIELMESKLSDGSTILTSEEVKPAKRTDEPRRVTKRGSSLAAILNQPLPSTNEPPGFLQKQLKMRFRSINKN